MKINFAKGIAALSSVFAVVLAGDDAAAYIVTGEQFTVQCLGSAEVTCDSQRNLWQTTNWTAGWNRWAGLVTVSGQLPVGLNGTTLFVRGNFTSGNSCRFVVTNTDGNLVTTNLVVAPVTGTQTLNLGNPVIGAGQALSVSCVISQNRWIGAAWQ